MPKQGYSQPELFNYSGDLSKEWYIGFRYTCSKRQVRKPIQLRMGINYHNTVKGREAESKAVIALIDECLKAGWNPQDLSIEEFLKREAEPDGNELEKDLSIMPFTQALQYAYDQKLGNLKKKSRQAYTSTKNFASTAATKLRIDNKPIGDIKKMHIKALLVQMGKDRQDSYDKAGKGKLFTNNSYNKYKSYLSAFFDELGEWDAMEYNPCDKIKDKEEIETGVHRHATDEELAIIKEKLPVIDPELYSILRFEYVTGMRPGEILQTTFDMVDWLNSIIRLSYIEGKTRIFREVPVPGYLLKWIKQRQGTFPSNYRIFGRGLVPNLRGINTNQLSRRWNDRVKKKLGVNISLYSFKGLGGDAKRDAGIGLKAVSLGYGHTSESTTKIYLRKEGERLRKQVIANAPDF